MKKIAIVQRTITPYRRDFYIPFRERLLKRDISFLLLYGQPSRSDFLKNDSVDLEWAVKVPSKIFEIGHSELYWQSILPYLKDVDLVIVEQASKLLVNYVLLLQNWLGIRKLAFWGHGKNFQETSANLFGEWIKRQVSTHIHWWFAYTEMSMRVVREMGFPKERITLVQNAVDTHFLSQSLLELKPVQITKVREELNLYSQNVGIYVGGLYPEKRIPFLLGALKLIRHQIPDFEMIFIGGGVDTNLVEQAAIQHPWIHFVGTKFDREKVPYYAISKLFLMPGQVGLGILDTFALETPLVTTDLPIHSPEIEYLQNGINGVMVENPNNFQIYANRIVELLRNPAEYNQLVENCRKSHEKYTIENMVENFANGVEKALLV